MSRPQQAPGPFPHVRPGGRAVPACRRAAGGVSKPTEPIRVAMPLAIVGGSVSIRQPYRHCRTNTGEGMSDRKRKEEPIPAPPKEVLLATAKNKYTSLITIRWVAMTLSVGLVLLAATPLANAIAGTETNFTVSISLAA